MNTTALDATRERYVSLATYRRDGREARTPVWIAGEQGVFYVFTAPTVGKVKRIRANGRASLAACTMRGTVTGPWTEARAAVVDDPAVAAKALRVLRAKYGIAMWVTDVMSRISGRFDQRAYIEIRL